MLLKGAHRGGEHDAGQVVVGKHNRTLDGAGGEHHALGAHPPQALPGLVGRRHRQVIADAFAHRQQILIVVAEGSGAAKNAHIGQRRKLAGHLVHPGKRGDVVYIGRPAPQTPAQRRAIIHQDNAGAAAPGRQGRAQAAGSGTHHQHVAVGEATFVVIRIAEGRRLAETGGGANDALVEHPRVARPHERLVVKACGQETRKDIVDAAHVEIQRRPTILTGRREPVEELDGGGT